MGRRARAVRRPVAPDPIYNSELVARFINNLMRDGKKSLAERIFYEAMRIIEERTSQPAETLFKQAVNNAKPVLEVKSRRVGGATYQVPVEVRPERRTSLAIKWLIQFARQRNDKTMAERLANEILAASRNEGPTIKKKEETHRMAEANKAFGHYRW